MSIEDKGNSQTPEPSEKDLVEALKNKDDIPILMDVILDDLKVKVSQEDYLFNSISDPIPVLSDVSDMDVENAFSEKAKPVSQPQPSIETLESAANEERDLVSEEASSSYNEGAIEQEASNINELEVEHAAEVVHVSEADKHEGVEHEPQADVIVNAEDSSTNEHFNDVSDELLEAAPEVIILPHEEDEISPSKVEPALVEDEPPVLRNITMVNTTTFNQDDLKSAIERAFVTLLPELMEQVLKELNSPTKKE